MFRTNSRIERSSVEVVEDLGPCPNHNHGQDADGDGRQHVQKTRTQADIGHAQWKTSGKT